MRWTTTSHLPLETGSIEVVYSSHILEHLPRAQAEDFLAEAHRVLKPGNVLHLMVPDLHKLMDQYLESDNTDTFVTRTLLAPPTTDSATAQLTLAMIGTHDHT